MGKVITAKSVNYRIFIEEVVSDHTSGTQKVVCPYVIIRSLKRCHSRVSTCMCIGDIGAEKVEIFFKSFAVTTFPISMP